MTGQGAIRVMLVDDHAVVREGYRSLIACHPDMAVVAEAADGTDAYHLYQRVKPHVVVMDLALPGRGGIDAIRQIRAWDPGARILVFSMHDGISFALKAFEAGARGYVTKSSPPAWLVEAVRAVARGGRWVGPDIAETLALDRLEGGQSPLDQLTPREFEIFRLLAEGRRPAEIARTLGLSAKTVANRHTQIKAKLCVSGDVELCRLAVRLGVVAVK